MVLKKPLKVLLAFFLICVICLAAVYVYALTYGRAMILSELEKNLGVKLEIASFRIAFPVSLVVEDVVVGENIRVDKIVVTPSLFGFLKGDVILNSCVLERPYFKITRKADETFDFGIMLPKRQEDSISEQPAAQESLPVAGKKKQKKSFYLKRLKIHNAVVDFIDEAVVPGKSFYLRLDDFCLGVFQASFLELSRMRLNASGRLKSQQGDVVGNIGFAGWFDYPARDMDTEVYLKDIYLPYLKLYSSKFFNKELESGDMMVSADLKSVKNALKADCHVELDHVVFQNNSDSSQDNTLGAGDFVGLVFNSVLSAQGKIVFDFSVQTKMDNPRFENVRLRGAFFKNGMQAIMTKGPQVATQLATGGVKETIDDFKEVGKKFEDFGRQFKDLFKKD